MTRASEKTGWPATDMLLDDGATGKGVDYMGSVAVVMHAVLDNQFAHKPPHARVRDAFTRSHNTWRLHASRAEIPMAGVRVQGAGGMAGNIPW
jgi:hypothetical protein